MLNDKDLAKILDVSLPALTLKDIHWRTEDSDENSILFYRIADDQKSQDLFHERIQNAKFQWLITNKNHKKLPKNATVIEEEKWPEVQKAILDKLYPQPRLKLMALTGTNGKTTTTDLVLQLGAIIGKKGLSIGTLGVRENHKTLLDFGLTSPSYIDLRKFLNLYGKDKDFCVLEASSHALVQHRLYGLHFDAAGWLSFSQDHLDYHKTMSSYFEAKCLLLKQMKPHAKIYVPAEQLELFSKISQVSTAVAMTTPIKGKLPLFFQTQFNRNNLEVALSIIQDVYKEDHTFNLDALIPPDGRFYIRPYGSSYIVVDFAHTPDALENICKGLKETFPQHRLKVLFGCGGDRDRSKRPKMAAVVDHWADEIYVTSDNPRSEDPAQIIDDILKGIKSTTFKKIIERPTAVQTAFKELKDNEILLLAGKGHEDYILIHGVKHPYSDIKQVDDFLARNAK
jgi:UDP-N-acetylmuramoyl-L-alanyl-D-glutamate--2,6-diaminopimelate ligase